LAEKSPPDDCGGGVLAAESFVSFRRPEILSNPFISLVAPKHGGPCGLISKNAGSERFWAEARVLEFCRLRSAILNDPELQPSDVSGNESFRVRLSSDQFSGNLPSKHF
jgi:hypothetical protein